MLAVEIFLFAVELFLVAVEIFLLNKYFSYRNIFCTVFFILLWNTVAFS